MKDAWSESRNRHAADTSAGVPSRRIYQHARSRGIYIGVKIAPGQTVFDRTRSGP